MDVDPAASAEGFEDEEISVRVDEAGNVNILADQISDYTLRPRELETMCLWDFAVKAEKVYWRKATTCNTSSGQNVDGRVDEVRETDSESDLDDGVAENSDGINGVEQYQFFAEHRECYRKRVRLRKRDVVPVPIGPALPRRDQTEVRARYCRLMVILFKPWRVVSDLRDANESWKVRPRRSP